MRYLTFSELCTKIGNRSRNAIYRDVERGDLPEPFKLGRQLYWNEQEVDQAIDELRQRRPIPALRSVHQSERAEK